MADSKMEMENRRGLYGGGPHGYGDPDDFRLRKIEETVLIPKILKTAAIEKCDDLVKKFVECSKKAGLLVTFKCKKENVEHQLCIAGWMKNEEFAAEVKKKYLIQRSYYRRTGKPLKWDDAK